jgi:hypothetical protein
MSVGSSDETTALLRLTRAILAPHVPQAAAMVAGRVPDGWPPELVPPSPVLTLGGMSADTSLTAVFLYPSNAETPVIEYRALLEGHGWKAPRGMLGDGFDSTRVAMLCHESSRATILHANADPAENAIMVSIAPNDGWPCRDDARMRPNFGTINVPRLVAPPGVRWDGGGGGGGGADNTNRHIRVATDLTPAELLPSYAKQLADAGWLTGAVQTTPASAIQWLEASDERGRVWRGMLTVYVNGPAREVFIYMATAAK